MNFIHKTFIIFLLTSVFALGQKENINLPSAIESSMMISVTIGGAFVATGSFPASITERVDQFVTRIYTQAVQNYNKDIPEKRKETLFGGINIDELNDNPFQVALRGITLVRSNGEKMNIDLAKFRINGDFVNNPYLKNDDVLIFPVLELEKNFFSIQGAVNKPGEYQYVIGDRLSDAIDLSMGINPAYENVNEVIISRLSYDGEKEEMLKFKITDNPDLSIGDRIMVLSEETGRKNFKVYLIGEVSKPGYINITKNNTTLRDVIVRAGGFKQNADLNRAELIRGVNVFKNILFTEEFENMMMMRMANITDEDSLSFAIDNKLRFARGNGIIDFNEILNKNSNEGNFIVKDGDVIFIPEKLNLVYVFGQVKKPGYIEFRQGELYDYYIAKADGKGEMAKDEVYVIKGQSRTWLEVKEKQRIEIEAGDYIWVPKDIPRTFNYYMDRITLVSSVVGTLATLILIILQVAK